MPSLLNAAATADQAPLCEITAEQDSDTPFLLLRVITAAQGQEHVAFLRISEPAARRLRRQLEELTGVSEDS
jgi:hypothetical protein